MGRERRLGAGAERVQHAAGMGRRGPPKKAETAGPLTKPLPAQGKGPNKRTPSSAFDPAAGEDNIYEPEKIVGGFAT